MARAGDHSEVGRVSSGDTGGEDGRQISAYALHTNVYPGLRFKRRHYLFECLEFSPAPQNHDRHRGLSLSEASHKSCQQDTD
jgi:hypothetical protein